MSFWGKIKGFIVSPTETFNSVKEEGWGGSIGYFAKLLVIYAILIALVIVAVFAAIWSIINSALETYLVAETVTGLEGFFGMAAGILAVVALISIIIGGIIGILISSLWMHIWVYIVGGRKGVGQTIKAMAYGSTPSLLLGWIPLVGIIFAIWSIVVSIIGIRELHEISTGRAVLAYLLGAIIIPAIIAVALFSALLAAFLAWTPSFT